MEGWWDKDGLKNGWCGVEMVEEMVEGIGGVVARWVTLLFYYFVHILL